MGHVITAWPPGGRSPLDRLKRWREPIILLTFQRPSERHISRCISRQSMRQLPVVGWRVNGLDGWGRACAAGLHAATNDMSLVLVGDLNVQVSWLNSPGQLSSVIERFGSGLVFYTDSDMPSTGEGNG